MIGSVIRFTAIEQGEKLYLMLDVMSGFFNHMKQKRVK